MPCMRGRACKGDILLFTDADIHMTPDAVARAVHDLEQAGLDHLCLLFKNKAKGWLLNSVFHSLTRARAHFCFSNRGVRSTADQE